MSGPGATERPAAKSGEHEAVRELVRTRESVRVASAELDEARHRLDELLAHYLRPDG